MGSTSSTPAVPRAAAAYGKSSKHIVLLGDSTIDNVCWTGHPNEVPAQLKVLLPDAIITNFAADGFTSTDLLNGAVPVISWVKRQKAGDPFPDCGEDRIFSPLELLKTLSPRPTHAVISIGGNDVREILGRMSALPEIMERFQANYSDILARVSKVVPNVVLMFQYRPSLADVGGYGVYQAIGSLPGPGDAVAKLNHLMETMYQPVLLAARQKQFAIVDLPRTFDICDDDLYCFQIEPSTKGGAIIAKLLAHVVQSHDFSGPSRLHMMWDGQLLDEGNDGSSRWVIPCEPSMAQADVSA
mmetsp:Transcript_54916/g.117845  ORF Transcript_54916/g.117845 Transcript_54916/m.117845 type:complete len:299 (+) Transcript_54916:75-971(+)